MTTAVVLLSGGQDSATCLAWAAHVIEETNGGRVYTLSFDYGQRHRVELACAARLADHFEVGHETLPVPALSVLGGASLTDDAIPVDGTGGRNAYADKHGLPQSFVPGRNAIFFATAAAYAAKVGAQTIVTGICQQDRAGYPDCREEFRAPMQDALRAALDDPKLYIAAPLIGLSKADTWQLAAELGVTDVIVEMTHTCYDGNHDRLNDWGYGCGNCGACIERARGYAEWQAFIERQLAVN